jgi:hypothetical protein
MQGGKPVVANYDEKVESQSPSTAGFGMEGGRAQSSYYFTSWPYSEVSIYLGKVTTMGDGRLQRVLPAAHPVYPWLSAERISNIQGTGRQTKVPSVAPLFTNGVNNIAHYSGYDAYLTTIEFVPRPYAILPDSAITATLTEWADEDGAPVENKFTNEYLRFTDYEILPDIDIITAQHGNMVFRTSGGGPDGKSFTGMPRVYIPKAVLKVRWFQVPYSYIEHTDSIILRYLGHINQAEFQLGNRLWPKGSLMYRGVSVKRYTPPIPNTTILAGLSVYSPEKICDLEFYFEYTRRVNAHPLSPNPSNKNRIQEGHNCMPHYGDRKFYYVTTQAALSANQYPTYPSVPFQLLWTDPANAS